MTDLHDTRRKLQEVQLLKALRLELLDLPGALAGSHLGRGVPADWALYIDRGDQEYHVRIRRVRADLHKTAALQIV